MFTRLRLDADWPAERVNAQMARYSPHYPHCDQSEVSFWIALVDDFYVAYFQNIQLPNI